MPPRLKSRSPWAYDGILGDQVQAIEIGFPPGTDTALFHTNPQTGLEGKFSIEYVAAATVLDGKVGIDTFTDVDVIIETRRRELHQFCVSQCVSVALMLFRQLPEK